MGPAPRQIRGLSTQTQVWELPRPHVHSHIIKAMRHRLIVCPRGDHIDPHVGPLVSFWACWSISEPSGHTINQRLTDPWLQCDLERKVAHPCLDQPFVEGV